VITISTKLFCRSIKNITVESKKRYELQYHIFNILGKMADSELDQNKRILREFLTTEIDVSFHASVPLSVSH
jgi:hypothetical protein